MPCISPDGRLTDSGRRLLTAAEEPATPEEMAGRADLPLFRVRSSLRELVQAGLIEEKENKYQATEKGREALQRSS